MDTADTLCNYHRFQFHFQHFPFALSYVTCLDIHICINLRKVLLRLKPIIYMKMSY